MSQATNVIAGGAGVGGLTVRTEINLALAAIVSGHSGTVRPSYVAAGTTWWDTATPGGGVWTLNYYDGANDVPLGTLDTSTHVFVLDAGLTMASTPALSDNSKKIA